MSSNCFIKMIEIHPHYILTAKLSLSQMHERLIPQNVNKLENSKDIRIN